MAANSSWLLPAIVLLVAIVSPSLSVSIGDQSATTSLQVVPRWRRVTADDTLEPDGHMNHNIRSSRPFTGIWRTPVEYRDRFRVMFNDREKLCSKCGNPIGRAWTELSYCGCLYHTKCLVSYEIEAKSRSSYDDPRCQVCNKYIRQPEPSRIQLQEIANLEENNLAPDECCPICHGELADELPAVQTVCGHVFHQDCLRSWERRSFVTDARTGQGVKCPMCRRDLIATSWPLP